MHLVQKPLSHPSMRMGLTGVTWQRIWVAFWSTSLKPNVLNFLTLRVMAMHKKSIILKPFILWVKAMHVKVVSSITIWWAFCQMLFFWVWDKPILNPFTKTLLWWVWDKTHSKPITPKCCQNPWYYMKQLVKLQVYSFIWSQLQIIYWISGIWFSGLVYVWVWFFKTNWRCKVGVM